MPFKDWPQYVQRRKLLADVPISVKAKFMGELPGEPVAAVYKNTQSGAKQISLLGMCCAVDI